MNIWIVCVGEPLPSDGNNPRLRRMGTLAAFLAKEKGNNVEWFSVSFDHYKKTQRTERNADIKLADNYTLHIVRVNGYRRNVSLARVIHHKQSASRILKRMKTSNTKPDVIVASMEPLEVSNAVVKFSKSNKIPAIVDVRDLWPEIYYEVLPKPLHPLLHLYVKRCSHVLSKTMKNASSIVGLSQGFLDYGLKYANREESCLDKVIPIGYPDFDKTAYFGNTNVLKSEYGISENDLTVLFLGNFGNQFNFEPIIDAAKRLSSYSRIKFVLCGNGSRLEEIKERTIGCNVVFTGWIEQEMIKTLACNSSMGIAPYINSKNYLLNTPNKFGEYLSYGLPVVLGIQGVMAQLIQENGCGCIYSSGEDLANEILRFNENPSLLNDCSRNARRLFERMFNAEDTNHLFLDVITGVINKEN